MDPLSSFRRPSHAVSAPPTLNAQGEEYAAFATKDRTARLRVRCAFEPSHALAYHCLLDVVYDDTTWTNFSLVFTFGVVLVRGEHLAPVVSAIEMGSADFIQEFDSARWRRPDARNATIITTIQVRMQGESAAPDALAENNQAAHRHVR